MLALAGCLGKAKLFVCVVADFALLLPVIGPYIGVVASKVEFSETLEDCGKSGGPS